jgi:hypothetical protein
MDPFTRAGLWRIAVACGATDEDVSTGDPAAFLVSRWLQAPVDDWFNDLYLFQDLLGERSIRSTCWSTSWLGLEDTGPLPFIRFAGFIEAGIRFGYLDLVGFAARDELRVALERWNLGDCARRGVTGLAVSLRRRLQAGAQSLSEPRDAVGVAAFESYMRLDESVRRDLDLREFLTVCHSERPHAKTDAIFLAKPEFFAEAVATRRVRRLPVGGQVAGGLLAVRALERLSRLLGGLGQREHLRNTLILHALWAHQVDKVFDRIQQWVLRAQEWSSDEGEWSDYLVGTVVPLVDLQRDLGLLDSDWHPAQLVNPTIFVDPEGTSPTEVENAISNKSKQADYAASQGYANEALNLYAEAGRLWAEHLNYEIIDEKAKNSMYRYWFLIKQIRNLGDKDTAAALCAVAYPELQKLTASELHHEREIVEELMESLRRPRSSERFDKALGVAATSDPGTIQQPSITPPRVRVVGATSSSGSATAKGNN